MRVLIVDDTTFMRSTIRRILEKNGIDRIHEAVDGKDAVNKYRIARPDLVIMDISMPVMDGIAAMHAIKEIDPESNVIICSLQGQRENVMQAIKAGAKSFLVKPIKEDKLMKEIGKLRVMPTMGEPKTQEENELLMAELNALSDQVDDLKSSLDYLKGIEEGYMECKREVTTNMLRLGLSMETITNCVELSEDEIKEFERLYGLTQR